MVASIVEQETFKVKIVSPEIFGWWRTHSFKNVGRDFMRFVA